MAGRTLAEAVWNHIYQVQRLVACVTSSVLVVKDIPGDAERRSLSFASGSADLAGVRLKLEVRQHFRAFEFGERSTLIVVGYHYAFLDAAKHQIVAYHWHPSGQSHVTEPHLHLGPAAQVRQRDLSAAHLPTGLIALTDVIELAIRDFAAAPRLRNWPEIIAEIRAAR